MSYYIIRGPLGCGKSTISEKLAKIINAEYFAVDRVLDEGKINIEEEEGYVSQNTFKKANDIIVSKATKFLKDNKSVIFDGNFYWKSQIDDLIEKLNFPHYVFTLKAPLELCIERDSERKKIHGKNAAIAVYKKSTEFTYGIEIDVSQNINDCIKEISSHISK